MLSNSKNILSELFDVIIDYIDNNVNKENNVIDYKTPTELKQELKLNISNAGISDDEILNEVKTYLDYSVKTGNKQFFNQLYAGFTIPGFIGEIITALTNTSMYTYEVAPVATLIERIPRGSASGYRGKFENLRFS